MCCRACHGYETCPVKTDLPEDCCEKCRLFEDCMENSDEADPRERINPTGKKYFKGRK
jgi:hypothetical protein